MVYRNQRCVDACNNCVSIAAFCSKACIEEGQTDCAKRCLECIEICRVMGIFAARASLNMSAVAALAARICLDCAAECDRHDSDHCKACADACRVCAAECRNISGDPEVVVV